MTETEWLDVFSNNLIDLIQDSGYTQKELSRHTGLSEAAISSYINKRRMPKITALFNLALVLDCELEDLTGYVDRIEF